MSSGLQTPPCNGCTCHLAGRGQSWARRYDAIMPRSRCTSWFRRAASTWVLAIGPVGCGGGLYLGIGGGDNDQPPTVALAASANEGLPGAVVRLVAAATDDFGVDQVTFLRREVNGTDTVLATDTTEPYQLDITLPSAPSGTVLRYLARARDDVGQSRDSTVLEITVR